MDGLRCDFEAHAHWAYQTLFPSPSTTFSTIPFKCKSKKLQPQLSLCVCISFELTTSSTCWKHMYGAALIVFVMSLFPYIHNAKCCHSLIRDCCLEMYKITTFSYENWFSTLLRLLSFPISLVDFLPITVVLPFCFHSIVALCFSVNSICVRRSLLQLLL